MNLIVPPNGRSDDALYPDSDGQPMAENTLQFEWIVTIKENLNLLFLDRPDVFVAGDLLWYAVKGEPAIRLAPDALVAFGRPKGYRGSYRQWEEGGIAPQVVFEVMSPGNRAGEMLQKREFYEKYGVEEYYVWDPDRITLEGWLRHGDKLEPIDEMNGWTSPRLAVRFELTSDNLRLFGPKGEPFLTFAEVAQQREEARQQAETERERADQAQQRAEQAQQRADQAQQRADQAQQRADQAQQRADEKESERLAAQVRAERLAAQLRALGIEPEG
jgi:Uma2 family endonuclease